jgi:hypothetical protein
MHGGMDAQRCLSAAGGKSVGQPKAGRRVSIRLLHSALPLFPLTPEFQLSVWLLLHSAAEGPVCLLVLPSGAEAFGSLPCLVGLNPPPLPG